ncbi:hypothetical protein E4T50_02539 [Aureobasidium sp. EXF-12298]|nr:hypothetical protein E4T50_02539 [Aureobasidium sp. EXF-12298]
MMVRRSIPPLLPKNLCSRQQMLNQRGKQHRGRVSEALERLERTWYLEAFCLLCSAACAALIVIFLVAHNNTHVDSWQFYFSINTVVSSLGVIFKLTLLFAVSAALAQGKWTWFRKRSDTLSTFEAIDAGSRGTVGSLKLLLRMRGQRLVSAGALVVAFGFMVQPFLQAVISEYGRLVDADPSGTSGMSATIGRSRRLDGGTQCISTYADDYPKIDTTPDFVISASLYDGLNAAGSHGYQNVAFTCFLGNCTWPEYVSIAIRSTCFDISDHLKRTPPEAPGETTVSTTRKSSPSTSSAAADSAETSASGTDPEMAMYPTAAPLSAFSDHSTVNSMVASLQSIATPAAVTTSTDVSQESSESEAPAGQFHGSTGPVYSDSSDCRIRQEGIFPYSAITIIIIVINNTSFSLVV